MNILWQREFEMINTGLYDHVTSLLPATNLNEDPQHATYIHPALSSMYPNEQYSSISPVLWQHSWM